MADPRIVLICPKIPPARDGVGDYTYQLAVELAKSCDVTIITAGGEARADACCRIVTVPDWTLAGTAGLWPMLESLRPSFINVQWVPFLWGRRGVNFGLPLLVWRLRRAGYRVVTTVHEPYVPFDMWRRIPLGVVQRLEFWLLVAGSVRVAVTISAWTRKFKSWFFWRADDFFWLPVGSAIPPVPVGEADRAQIRRSLGADTADPLVVVFNPRGAGKMRSLSSDAWDVIQRRHPSAKLLLIGCDAGELHRDEFAARDRVMCTGYVSPGDASRYLSAADLCLTPYVDGVSARRSSMMAVMEHGVPIVSTIGHLTDNELFANSPLALADVADESGFVAEAERLAADAGARRALGSQLKTFHRDNFSWPLISSRLLRHCLEPADGR